MEPRLCRAPFDDSSILFCSVWSRDTLAVVTGANKGIGLEIVKQMSLKGLTVVLTARDRQRGLDALSKVRSELGLSSDNLIFHPLDVCSSDSVSSFSAWINEKYGGLDILVRNNVRQKTSHDYGRV